MRFSLGGYISKAVRLIHFCALRFSRDLLHSLERSTMFFSALLFSLFTNTATSLPNNLPIRNSGGNPYDPKCKLDACLVEVIGVGLFPNPGLALNDCSAALQKTSATSSSAAIKTITITASQSQSTSSITQVQTVFSTTLVVGSETGTIVSIIYSTETDDVATSTSTDVVEVTSSTSSTSLQQLSTRLSRQT